MATTPALREALNQGISSGNLVDTKIILFSHRDSSGHVSRPKALYASSHVLKKITYFSDLLGGNFAESESRDFDEPNDEEDSAECYDYLSDSDLEDDDDERLSLKHTAKSKPGSFDPFQTSSEGNTIHEKNDEHVGKGKVVKVQDIAFVTFQAFLMYLYTDVIEFAPFGSEENRRSRSEEIVDPSDDKVPQASPKSIYRLADKYDISKLKALALNNIRSKLWKCDIVEESFSRFASKYSKIRELYVNQLAHTWVMDSTDTIRLNVEKKIDSFAGGNLDHATEVVTTLWKIGNKDGNITAPVNGTSPTVILSPAHWGFVKSALIKSIRTGVFFDRKYWARHRKGGSPLQPVHFSSTIMDDKVNQLNKMVKYLKRRNTLVNDLEGDVNIESDCEGYIFGTSEPEEKEDEICAVLIVGSFSAWRSLFFYRCTDSISFAPLKSQGLDSRSQFIREKTVPTAPPPCSPKSIYVLANLVRFNILRKTRNSDPQDKLEIKPLCENALADIKSKVSQSNVVDEVFSWITAIKDQILEMECELLISNFKNPKTIDLVSENIERISNGSSPHAANALKLGLKKAFDLKKGAKLRCSYSNCKWNTNPDSYSNVAAGSGVYCQNCRNCGWGSRYFQCTLCGSNRTGISTSCQGCGKPFL